MDKIVITVTGPGSAKSRLLDIISQSVDPDGDDERSWVGEEECLHLPADMVSKFAGKGKKSSGEIIRDFMTKGADRPHPIIKAADTRVGDRVRVSFEVTVSDDDTTGNLRTSSLGNLETSRQVVIELLERPEAPLAVGEIVLLNGNEHQSGVIKAISGDEAWVDGLPAHFSRVQPLASLSRNPKKD